MSKRICPLAHSTLFMILNTLALVLNRGPIIVSTFNRVVSLVHSILCRRWDANARKTGENNCTSIRSATLTRMAILKKTMPSSTLYTGVYWYTTWCNYGPLDQARIPCATETVQPVLKEWSSKALGPVPTISAILSAYSLY